MQDEPIAPPSAAAGLRSSGLRPADAADAAVVREARIADRRARLAAMDWPAAMLDAVSEQQHDLLEAHIAAHHPQAERWTILAGDAAVGGLCLDRGVRPWRLVDIVLLPAAQSRGLGTAAIRAVLAQADGADEAVELHVAPDNPRADALYRRLGFRPVIGAPVTHARLLWTKA